MRGNLFYIVHPAGQLKELNRRASLGELEEKLDPNECTAAVNRLSRVLCSDTLPSREEQDDAVKSNF